MARRGIVSGKSLASLPSPPRRRKLHQPSPQDPRKHGRTPVRDEGAPMNRCSFCGSTTGPFSKIEGLFTVLMCADCQAARGHGSGPYPVMTRAPSARRTRPATNLGPGAEGCHQPASARHHTQAPGRRRGGCLPVPGAGAGLAGAASRGRRGAGRETEANGGQPPGIMTCMGGKTRTPPSGPSRFASLTRTESRIRLLSYGRNALVRWAVLLLQEVLP
jgi:hypothetical protein